MRLVVRVARLSEELKASLEDIQPTIGEAQSCIGSRLIPMSQFEMDCARSLWKDDIAVMGLREARSDLV